MIISDDNDDRQVGAMTVEEAGRKGGNKTALYGAEFYRKIGKKGGQSRGKKRKAK